MLETPVDAYYIRTGLPGLLSFQYDPLGDIQWNITIAGLARNNFNLSVASLKRRASPMGSVVMECSGNTRFWRFGLKSIGNFTKGIRLADLIDELYSESKYKNGGKGMPQHILVEGFDKHVKSGGGTKGASWIFSMEQIRSTRMFLAFEQNGEPLAYDHGFPVRLVVPGWYGCSHIKWVTLIQVVDARKMPPTSQMREFRSRVHMERAPRKSSLKWSAQQLYSATAERVEIWRHRTSGEKAYKAVGLFWGGEGPLAPSDNLLVRIAPLQPSWTRVQIFNARPQRFAWSQWCHSWRFARQSPKRKKASRVQVSIEINIKKARSVRLNKGRWGKNWYARKFWV